MLLVVQVLFSRSCEYTVPCADIRAAHEHFNTSCKSQIFNLQAAISQVSCLWELNIPTIDTTPHLQEVKPLSAWEEAKAFTSLRNL